MVIRRSLFGQCVAFFGTEHAQEGKKPAAAKKKDGHPEFQGRQLPVYDQGRRHKQRADDDAQGIAPCAAQ